MQIRLMSRCGPVLERQIAYNTAISQEGLKGGWGAEMGRTLLKLHGDSLPTKLRAAAAGSDARMNGCELPVVIVSGSGNQGMTASLPVIEYAEAIGADHEALLRALAVSDLITIPQKTGIGPSVRILRRDQRRLRCWPIWTVQRRR